MDDENGLPRTNGSARRVHADSDPAQLRSRLRRRRMIRAPGRGAVPEHSSVPEQPEPSRESRGGDRAVHGGALGVRVGDFFGELAEQLARRWVSLLVIPGMLFLVLGWAGLQLGHTHALDVARLSDDVSRAATQVGNWSGAAQGLAVGAALLAAVAAGLVVQTLVGPVRTLCLGQWTGKAFERLADSQVRHRQHRWKELYRERAALEMVHPAHDRTTEQQRRIDRVAGRTNQIAMAEPGSPTWMGDRMHALAQVAIDRYGLDLTFGWSRLWLVLPGSVRTEINTAQRGFGTAVFVIAWSVPYFALGVLWWPAAFAGLAIAAAGRSRARAKITNLTEEGEAAVDVHGRSLAVALGVAKATSTGPLSTEEGRRITDIARKGR